jgi:hypothetical protein
MIVNLAIPSQQHAWHAASSEAKRLGAAFAIKQRQSSMRKRDVTFMDEARIIRSSMRKQIPHRLHERRVNGEFPVS